eukprot:1639082-Rhodomonas_salina.1
MQRKVQRLDYCDAGASGGGVVVRKNMEGGWGGARGWSGKERKGAGGAGVWAGADRGRGRRERWIRGRGGDVLSDPTSVWQS